MADQTVESHVANINNLIMQIAEEINGINQDINELSTTRERLQTTVVQLNDIALHLKGDTLTPDPAS